MDTTLSLNSPLISVVMAVYNGDKYLGEAIDSILNQTFENFELIIINDGSSDASQKIINSYNDNRIVSIIQENTGLSSSLNRGIRLAKGKYIARMDADDICLPDRFWTQINFLENNPDYIVVGSNAHRIDKTGKFLYTSVMPISWEEIKNVLPQVPFYHSSTMFRKDAFIKCGGYSEIIKNHGEDWLLWNKMFPLGKFYNIETPLIKYRIVPGSLAKRTQKTYSLMHSIGMNILNDISISQLEIDRLQKLLRKKSQRSILSDYYLRIGKVYIENNFIRSSAFKNILKSLTFSPINLIAWINLGLLILPYSKIQKWKDIRSRKQLRGK